jgi:hypothetical protein
VGFRADAGPYEYQLFSGYLLVVPAAWGAATQTARPASRSAGVAAVIVAAPGRRDPAVAGKPAQRVDIRDIPAFTVVCYARKRSFDQVAEANS